MASLYLSDILRRNGLDPKRVKLIRHSLSDKDFLKCFQKGYINEYQKIQKHNFFQGCDYILTFISEPGTSAKFMGCYKVGSGEAVKPSMMPLNFPIVEMFNGPSYYYDLQKVDILSDLDGRLIIDWGRAAISWQQWATNDKAIVSIQASPRLAFNGFENVVINYDELKDIVTDPTLYENWHTALSSIYAIYLITDQTNGKLYVGSAYGTGGLLSRWKYYVRTQHGDNKGIKAVLEISPDRYENFQFSILQILPKNITAEEVVEIENLYKRKLMSIKYGMNEN